MLQIEFFFQTKICHFNHIIASICSQSFWLEQATLRFVSLSFHVHVCIETLCSLCFFLRRNSLSWSWISVSSIIFIFITCWVPSIIYKSVPRCKSKQNHPVSEIGISIRCRATPSPVCNLSNPSLSSSLPLLFGLLRQSFPLQSSCHPCFPLLVTFLLDSLRPLNNKVNCKANVDQYHEAKKHKNNPKWCCLKSVRWSSIGEEIARYCNG